MTPKILNTFEELFLKFPQKIAAVSKNSKVYKESHGNLQIFEKFINLQKISKPQVLLKGRSILPNLRTLEGPKSYQDLKTPQDLMKNLKISRLLDDGIFQDLIQLSGSDLPLCATGKD